MPRPFLIFLLGAVLWGGCETSVDPIVGSDRAYSLYGVLQPRADTQWLRIYPIEDRLRPTSPEPLDVAVTSIQLETDQQLTWRDSIIQEDDGRNAHAYWHPLRVEHDQTYRLEATGARGTAGVTVRVPPEADLARQPSDVRSGSVLVPVRVTSDVPRLIRVEVTYHVQYDEPENVVGPEPPTTRIPRSYDDAARRTDGGWTIPINLSDDFQALREELTDTDRWNPRFGLVMIDMTLRLAVVNDEWNPPDGIFDADVLVEPGTMSNVENGFGFVGAGYRLEETWTPDDETLTAAGWTVPADEDD